MIDPAIVAAGFVLGGVIGLTGMGGGALLTPLLVGVFHIPPGLAVASDLVASALMKPFGAAIHLRSRTADISVVRWLVVGSVPTAFAAPILAGQLFGHGLDEQVLRLVIGVMVVLSSLLGLVRTAWTIRERRRGAAPTREPRRAAICALGAVAGLLVGLTSVGSGSLVSAGLVLLVVRPRTSAVYRRVHGVAGGAAGTASYWMYLVVSGGAVRHVVGGSRHGRRSGSHH
ncbi:sulfite exporter TauE/SafE family protein [Actinokineospora enzanensis]|uniref:sulfite exporter TauE/SafE family protein n=1 Tax=Actinokineospora enzanensis TaxID=155975 RepID=UPI00039DC232|nr:sulfite exporter TauE/SafE family protein [Actinokineospora enzanensis]